LQKVDPNDQSISVTNDGATILRSVHVDNAAAKVLVDISKVQDDVVGDGTTTVAVLCGELLREAEQLVNQRIHPQTICAGWRLAQQTARKALEDSASKAASEEAFRAELIEIAETTLSSKLVTYDKKHFAALAVDAVLRLRGSNNLDHIQVLKKAGGSMRDTYLESGFLLDKTPGVGQPKRVENAKILIANTSMDTDKIKIYGSRVKVDSIDKVADIEQAEKEKMRTKVTKILAHDCNVFINRQLIYNFPESIFTENGVMAIEHADFDGVERLAAVLGGEVTSTFDHPEQVILGECEVIEEVCGVRGVRCFVLLCCCVHTVTVRHIRLIMYSTTHTHMSLPRHCLFRFTLVRTRFFVLAAAKRAKRARLFFAELPHTFSTKPSVRCTMLCRFSLRP
jgi:T-complex protein 1 subunit beta